MPEIEPFRGLLYDTSKVAADKVLAPPYDVIDADERKRLAERHEANCVHLILPEGEGAAKYAGAAERMNGWIDKGILARDQRPAVYRYHQQFKIPELGDRTFTRKGFIAAVRLHAFDEGVILPHERTLKGPKVDRLALMEATNTHLSQIFTLYSDPSRSTDALFKQAEHEQPYIDSTTDDGTRHLLWRVADREAIGKLQKLMSGMKLYIADGHHRYETMLALRESYRKRVGELSYKSAAQYGTLFCANMDDEGLVVLPTHRLVHSLEKFDLEQMLQKAREHFEVFELEGGAGDMERVKREIHERGGSVPTFAVLAPGKSSAWVLQRSFSATSGIAGLEGSRAVVDLDVTLLHELVIDRILGVDKAAQEAKTNIKYVKDTRQAFERTAAGEGQVCFIMNPTRLPQIRAVAEAGEFMPQKSTFFYPKIASGVVFNRIDPNEDLY